MPAILERPYAGTWAPNQRKVTQWTPDALVYLNGDTSLSGCRTCHHRIDIQQFVTSVSVDAGVEPGASSASVTLAIPKSYGDSIFRDGNTLLRCGLEIHVYFRGYFPMTGLADPDADPRSATVSGVRLTDIPQYPYYPAFHGVVTQVSHENSGGYFSASLACSGMLHFWQYMQIAANGAFFGARPNNSGVRTNLRGHVFTGMSPFAIIYSLYRDTMGSAAGVGFALQSRTNMQAVSTASGDSLYSMALRYWEQRFAQGMYGLRMHGASGQLFSGSTQAYLARLGGTDARIISVVTGNDRRESNPLSSSAAAFNLIDRDGDGRINRGADLRFSTSSGGAPNRDFGVVVPQMQAFVNDVSQWGQVNLFETTYESKLDIATQVSNICGYEFYQDADGDLVFKPPLYNLDTSSSRVYRLEPEDIISISFSESEPEATYATVSGSPFQNMRGVVDEAEFGVRSTYYDYRLIAQFGWREGSLESNYYSNARSAFYAAVANLDRINQGMNAASVTIPLRPEIRQGFPVFIPHIDCFYYVQSVSHAFTFGGSCTTTLNLVARRRKFIPPGNSTGDSVGSIDLGSTNFAPRSLQYLDNSGVPRVLGFPNVVMALDPERINPLFFLFGLDAEESGVVDRGRAGAGNGLGSTASRTRSELLASNFAQVLVMNGILGVNPVGRDSRTTEIDDSGTDALIASLAEGGVSTPIAEVSSPTPISEGTAVREDIIAPASGWWIQTGPAHGIQISPEQLLTGLRALITERGTARRRITHINTAILRLQNRIQRTGDTEDGRATAQRLADKITVLRTEASTLNEFLAGSVATPGADAEPSELVNFLIGEVRRLDPPTAGRDMSVDATGSLNNSATILDLLNDRKASLGLNTPGYYRYYSSAHPVPAQQGYVELGSNSAAPADPRTTAVDDSGFDSVISEVSSGAASESSFSTVGVEPLTGEDISAESNFEVNLSEEQLRDYVKLVNKSPVNGLNVRTFNSQDPVPTSTDQIFAITFEQRTASRFGSTTTFVVHDGRTLDDVADALRACLTGTSALGTLLGTRFATALAATATGLGDVSITGGALVERAMAAVGGISGLTAGTGDDRAPITSFDIAGGTPNNTALLNGAGVTDVVLSTLGSTDTATARAENILTGKGQNLVHQVSGANQAAVENAIRILGRSTLVSDTASSTATVASPTASESDTSLASRADIPPTVMRSIRAIESSSSSSAVRFERHLFARLTGVTIDGTGTSRATFDQVLATYPQYREELIRSTSWGSYQVLGHALLETHPSDPIESFDRDPNGVSDDVLVRFFNTSPPARRAANAVGTDPSEANIAELARVYNGDARDDDGSLTLWGDRFTAALSSGAGARTGGTTRRRGGRGGRVVGGSNSAALSGALGQWLSDMHRLFGGSFPEGGSLPFHFRTDTGVVREPLNTFSPVFPVSDAVGYEHYGTYQYGRGLSIEPGGNYETLMGTDPFQYVDPDLAYAFANAVRREGAPTGADGSPVLGRDAWAALRAIASDEEFAHSPGADIAIRVFREDNPDSDQTESTAMIASGLANYVMSSRDAITHLPVSNVAFRLADLNPNITGEDTCVCRGAEADLLIAAYMSGSSATTFVSVENAPDQASRWVSQQMVLAADSWTLSQNALRGAALTTLGRRSVFDSVQGILGIASQLTAPVDQLGSDLSGVTDPTSQNLRRLNEISGRIDRTF